MSALVRGWLCATLARMTDATDADATRPAWRAAVAGMTEPPLSDDELDALRRILLDQGGSVSREAAIELLLEALWWRGRGRRRGEPEASSPPVQPD